MDAFAISREHAAGNRYLVSPQPPGILSAEMRLKWVILFLWIAGSFPLHASLPRPLRPGHDYDIATVHKIVPPPRNRLTSVTYAQRAGTIELFITISPATSRRWWNPVSTGSRTSVTRTTR